MTMPLRSTSMLQAGTFAGQTVLITGGGTGLGRSLGEQLLKLSANLVICGRRQQVLDQTAEELANQTGGRVLPVPCDVREPAQVEAMLDKTYATFGGLQALVNNAAGNFICPTQRLSYNAFHTIVAIVLGGTSNCTLAAGKRWIADGTPGTMLNIVATYAWTGSGYVVPSAVAKAGVLALTRSLASEWAKYGIRTNAIAPGPFPTEGAWSRLVQPQVAERFDFAAKIPLGRVGEHQELVNLAAYLLSDYSAYINGDCITIDGGEWLRGGGEFNYLEALTAEEWDELQATLKPKK
jgi:NAD(P)-dependent dehydrogenase (short-subunit alcohol dehydrogenase family)